MANRYGAIGEELVRQANGPLQSNTPPPLTEEQQLQQLQQVQDAQRASLNSNNPAFPTHGTAAGDAVPLNQQKFGFEKPRLDVSSHAPMPGPTYVPGMGMVGATGGYVKGDMARQEFNLKANDDSRAEAELGIAKEDHGIKKDYLKIAQEDLGIRKSDLGMRASDQDMEVEKFGWERGDHNKKMEIEAGMKQAAQSGGYTGVIDYLKTADPAMALKFHGLKLELDDNIMKNDVAKDLLPVLKNKAVVEGYGVMAKMGQALINAKPEERENMYKTILPILRKINPKMPDNLAEATPLLAISIAAGTPESMLLDNQNKSIKYQGEVAKNNADKERLIKEGKSLNDPVIKAIDAKISLAAIKQQQAEENVTQSNLKQEQTMQQTESKVFESTEKYNKVIQTGSKGYLGFADTYSPLMGALDSLKKDPNNSQAQGQLGNAIAKMSQVGIVTDPDYDRAAKGMSGFSVLTDKIVKEWTTGKKVNLSVSDVANLTENYKNIFKQMQAAQLIKEEQWQKDAQAYGTPTLDEKGQVIKPAVINKDRIRMPSVVLKQRQLVNSNGFQDYDPPTQELIGKYLDQGVSPGAIRQMLEAKKKGR